MLEAILEDDENQMEDEDRRIINKCKVSETVLNSQNVSFVSNFIARSPRSRRVYSKPIDCSFEEEGYSSQPSPITSCFVKKIIVTNSV